MPPIGISPFYLNSVVRQRCSEIYFLRRNIFHEILKVIYYLFYAGKRHTKQYTHGIIHHRFLLFLTKVSPDIYLAII